MEIKINEMTTTSVQASLVPSSPPIPTINTTPAVNPADRIPENWDIVPSDKNEMWFVYNNKATGSHFEGPKSEFMTRYMKS